MTPIYLSDASLGVHAALSLRAITRIITAVQERFDRHKYCLRNDSFLYAKLPYRTRRIYSTRYRLSIP